MSNRRDLHIRAFPHMMLSPCCVVPAEVPVKVLVDAFQLLQNNHPVFLLASASVALKCGMACGVDLRSGSSIPRLWYSTMTKSLVQR